MPSAIVYAVGYLAEYGAISAATAAAIGGFVGTYGAAIMLVGGLAYSAEKERQAKADAKNQFNAAQVDRLTNISSAVAPRELVLGRVRKAGTVFYKASTGTFNKDLYFAIALAGHEIDAVEQIYINDVPVTLDGSGNVTTAPYLVTSTLSGVGSTGSGNSITLPSTANLSNYIATYTDFSSDKQRQILTYATSISGTTLTFAQTNVSVSYQYTVNSSNVNIAVHLGNAGDPVDAALNAAFPSAWGGNNTVQGIAYLRVKLTYSESSFPSGAPTVTATIRGAKVYDPRSATTVWSENPALLMRHVYQHPKFGKATVTATEDARFIAVANACDTATVYTVGGVAQASRALFTAGTVAPFGTAAKSLFDDLSQAMGGSWAFYQGELYLKAGVYSASVLSLGDADLATVVRNGASESQNPIKISPHRERAKKFNTVKATIWDASQGYKQTVLTPLQPSTYLARDGAELVQNVSMAAVNYAPQALHVAGIMLRDARDPLMVDVSLKMRAYPLELFDTVDLTIVRFGWAAKTFMVIARSWAGDGVLHFTLKETTAAITQMDAGFPAQGYAANTNLPSPWVVADVGALTVTSGTSELLKQIDGTVVSRMRVAWAAVPDMAVQQSGKVEVQFRRSDSTGAWISVSAAGNDTSAVTSEVQDGITYVIRARAITSLAIGQWGAHTAHTVIGKTEAPPPFDYFAIFAQPDGTRQYNFSYNAGNKPADWLGAEIRYISGTFATPTWAAMTPLQDTATYYTSSPVELNAPLSGAYTFACKSLDTSGNESTYLVRNITLPNRRLGNMFDSYDEAVEGWLGSKTGCQVLTNVLEAIDSTTWATLPATWDSWLSWNISPTSPIYYETPVRDLGVVLTGYLNTSIAADGSVSQQLSTSNDNITWSAYGDASTVFTARYLKVKITVTATASAPVPTVRGFAYEIDTSIKSEYINDVAISSLTGANRIGVGDIRIPLQNSYTYIKRTGIVIQDNSAGSWSYTRQDQLLSPGPRWQFRLNGVLADPAFVDFFIEGF